MKILIDADACPVVHIVERQARDHQLAVLLLCDTNHLLTSDYCEVQVVEAGRDAVDFALIEQCRPGDIVVTQDYGVAAMALGKGARCIQQTGKWYTDENIDQLLMARHLARKDRASGRKPRGRGPAKRTTADDGRFEASLIKMIETSRTGSA